MEFVSVFNDVLGPVMRGPSSSHTAGSYHIGAMVRSLMEGDIASAAFTFDPDGSYARVYRQQGVDLAFAVGLLGWPLTDERFGQALDIARREGIDIHFEVAPLANPDHPNKVEIELRSSAGRVLKAEAQSIGGGMIRFTQLQDWPVELTGKAHEIVVVCEKEAASKVQALLDADKQTASVSVGQERGEEVVLVGRRVLPLAADVRERIEKIPGVTHICTVSPVYHVKRGDALFASAEEMVKVAEKRGCSLGQAALDYEAELLGMAREEALDEMMRRFEIMKQSAAAGLDDSRVKMQLLRPSAHNVFQAESEKRLAVGGIHTRAAARALAVMHASNSMDVVCAAPTGGSAGVIPGVVVTLAEERNLTPRQVALALFAASAVGLIICRRATFAAEEAGCQVEIGAAGAMAAAAVVEIAGGSAAQAADAAAIALQNTMGSVCDLVQGMCEIPCHTRNAAAASSAFVCADLILGGYRNPIPLDETVDAVLSVGRMLPRELRCTALGGLAAAPSAQNLTLRT